MSGNHREQIRTYLLSRDTEYLLDIWQNGDVEEWVDDTFEIVKEILFERLGHIPPQSVERQVALIFRRIEDYLESGAVDKAIHECEAAIQLSPDSAIAYEYRGDTYDLMGQFENAIINYQKAIELDPERKDAWEKMLVVEAELGETFQESIAKQHLDSAIEFACNDEPEKALAECETAKPLMPSLAIAYNYLGLILQTIDQLEPAIDSYIKAIQLNPRFYAARENLANARKCWEEEQYREFSDLNPVDLEETIAEFDESAIQESDELTPQWLYMDRSGFLLVGWPGHRTRYGRSGYDPLETEFENAHMQGVIIKRLLNRKFRTRNSIYLLLMTFVGVLFFLAGIAPLTLLDFYAIVAGIITSPLSIVGALLLVNVYLSLRLTKSTEYDDNGSTFF